MKYPVQYLLLFLIISCSTHKPGAPASADQAHLKPALVSNPSADPGQFPYAVTVKDLNQQDKLSSEILHKRDRPTVLMFWLTTCGPCAKELKSITANYTQWQQEVPFHLVAMSEDQDKNFNAILERVRGEKWPFETYWDYNRNFGALMPGNLNGLPQTFIFDKNGKLTFSRRGYLPGYEATFFEKIKEAAKS
jgi:thiol-disulfide isomerase/thioredoxin